MYVNYNQVSIKFKDNTIHIMSKGGTNKTQNMKLKQKSETTTNITHASQRRYQLVHKNYVKYLNIDYFKLNPCSNTKQHLHKHCVNYHNAKDRKRYGNFYSDNMCEFISKGEKCPKGDQCTDSHSRVQQLYQYQTYKKKFCSHFPANVEKCQYGEYCSFAHSEDEIRIELIHNYEYDEDFYMFHYKTEFCPFNLTEHDKALCVYAHNLQDYRRNPSLYFYEPVACFNWKLKDYIYNYQVGCENGLTCNMCHGWKQIQYHPNSYKTTKCLQQKCRKGECPNYHSEKQKRIIQEDVTNRCFRYVPRNRIVNGVFKPQSDQSFVPRHEIKMHTVIGSRNNNLNYTNSDYQTDFSTKTTIQKIEKSQKIIPKKQTKYFCDKQFAESDNESNDSDIKNQVQKLLD